MKKAKLSLDKLQVKSFSTSNQRNLRGGAETDFFCNSVDSCPTVDYTACYGENNCGIWDPNRTN